MKNALLYLALFFLALSIAISCAPEGGTGLSSSSPGFENPAYPQSEYAYLALAGYAEGIGLNNRQMVVPHAWADSYDVDFYRGAIPPSAYGAQVKAVPLLTLDGAVTRDSVLLLLVPKGQPVNMNVSPSRGKQ